jgi:Transposase
MQDTALYQYLLGLQSPWTVSRVNLDVKRQRVDVWAEHPEDAAWAIKEALRRLWHYVYPASGWKFWKRWYFWATHSRLEPIRKAAGTVRRHIDNILTYY